MKRIYKEWRPGRRAVGLIIEIDGILSDYMSQGYVLTLRQLYYQLVARDLIPNTFQSYKRVGDIVSRGRMAGFIDWDMIEDRVRTPRSRSHWDSPAEILRSASKQYYRSRWDSQPDYLEVWVEKDAVSNIVEPVCREFDVTFMANRGYSSQSAMYHAGVRFIARADRKRREVIYLGDHDPSGIDMVRDIHDRLDVFTEGVYVDVNRVALNMDQIEQFRPPENPAKITDSRYWDYVDRYGGSSWELDALEPSVLSRIVRGAITGHVVTEEWERVERLERDHKESLEAMAIQWEGQQDG